jgi:MOSC domain-containing protein YiiM
METIERLQAEGHPIEPGSAGENLTTAGVEVGRLAPGTRLLIGPDPPTAVELELNVPANPCKTIRGSFRGGAFSRLSAREHPGDTRVYAWVRRPGTVRTNDPIRVLPPAADSEGSAFPAIQLYEAIEASSTLALWQATQAAGYAMRVVGDGELRMGASESLAGSAWNQVRGYDMLPDELPRIRRFASAATHPIVLHARRPPWPDAEPVDIQVLHAAEPDGVARVKIAGDVTLREATAEDAAGAAEILIAASSIPEPEAGAWRAIARVPLRHGSYRFVAEVDGRLAATATLRVRGTSGLLRGAAVLPEFRGRGLQMALTAARAARATDLGAQLLVVTAAPGSRSEQNLRRSGFAPVAEIGAYRLPGLPEPPAG